MKMKYDFFKKTVFTQLTVLYAVRGSKVGKWKHLKAKILS